MKISLGLIFLAILLTFGVSHASTGLSVNLNMNITSFQSGTCSALTPTDIQNAYGFNLLYNSGISGQNENIAIIIAQGDPTLTSDLNTFDSAYNLPSLVNGSNLFVEKPYGSSAFYSANWTEESGLDVEIVHSLAPDAKIYLVVAPNISFLYNVTEYAINNLPVSIISISWGASENSFSGQSIAQEDSAFALAAQKKIAVFAASGDTGAYNGMTFPNVNYPASSPNVIAVGGTVLSVSQSGTYESETAWSDSGGGYSQFFLKPAPQPNMSANRMVPDVAFNSGTAICAYVGSNWEGYTGTSVAAPSWAALGALVNQKAGSIGAISFKSLYDAYYSDKTKAFNAIDSGSNGVYNANGSYNLVTGLGSPKAYGLVSILSSALYTLHFNSTYPETVFKINGVNYTSPVTLNFSYGENVSVKSYSMQQSSDERYNFDYYSGYANSNSQNISFVVNASGTLTANFNLQFRVLENNVNGYSTVTKYVNAGTNLDVNSSLETTSGSSSYSLFGFSVDNGPVIHESSDNLLVGAAINVSFLWLIGSVSKFEFLNAPAGAQLTVSYLGYIPLTNSSKEYSTKVTNGGEISSLRSSVFNYSSVPIYLNGSRYVVYNSSVASPPSTTINFVQESKHQLQFISDSGLQVYPTQVSINFDDFNESFPNSTVWVPSGSGFLLEKVIVDDNGINALKAPFSVPAGQASQNISLPVQNLKVLVGLYLGIPIVAANVNFKYGNASLANSTGLNGVATFYNVPQSNYNITINAYGTSYQYSDLSGSQQTLQIAPLIYQLYLLISVISVVVLAIVVFELIRKKRSQKAKISR